MPNFKIQGHAMAGENRLGLIIYDFDATLIMPGWHSGLVC